MAFSWKDEIGSCFGIVDKKFALHPSDAKHAAKLLANASQSGVGFEEFCNALKDWMEKEGCSNEHIEEQMKNIKDPSFYFQYD